jgi:hypothetical protein
VDEAGHDANLALAWRNDAGAVRSDQATVIVLQDSFHAHHVLHGHTFGNAHNQTQAGVSCSNNSVGRSRRGHKNDTHVGTRGFHGFFHGVKHRAIQVLFAAAPWRDTSDNLCAVVNALLGMKGTLSASQALTNYFRIFINKNTHWLACPESPRPSPRPG